ncbi:YgjP-like metallopeptidase domain-containing protein [Uliginosibacterium paludis]|uniref:YgjP-like metallopeptidase domain-containing protein n=1 Tax=Uliginosibacterium paludis TaxID=1615952 RepID=A0ABV2CQJ5_9RHOO
MTTPLELNYLAAYPQALRDQVAALWAAGKLGEALLARYPVAHVVKDDRALHAYVDRLRQTALRNSAPLSRVCFDSRLQTLRNALGTHTAISRVQGGKLRAKREIRVASVFREAPEAFLRMIVVHELAHVKERQHDKAFYQLCCHMTPDYHQLEFDVRTWLCHVEAGGSPLWPSSGQARLHALKDE